MIKRFWTVWGLTYLRNALSDVARLRKIDVDLYTQARLGEAVTVFAVDSASFGRLLATQALSSTCTAGNVSESPL